jgi:hypothetical protein
VDEVVRRHDRVHHRDHGARLGGAEPRERELGAVGQHDQHPVLDGDVEAAQRVREAVGVRVHLRVRVGEVAPAQARLAAAALLEVAVEEVPRHVEALGELHGGHGQGSSRR